MARIAVHLLIRGRIGAGWYEVDEQLKLPAGTTLAGLIDAAERRGIPLRQALADSPHLAETLMLNGERCPISEHGDRVLGEGDQIYLLAPLAGG
jgi:sulfur carrier protein ThiS